MSTKFKTLMLSTRDQVATALERIPADTIVQVECQGFSKQVKLLKTIEFGHKFAVCSIQKGQDILKYGEVIGVASQDISEGDHVHTHNLEGKRGRGDKIEK
jgi:altronate dehydratase small subunit